MVYLVMTKEDENIIADSLRYPYSLFYDGYIVFSKNVFDHIEQNNDRPIYRFRRVEFVDTRTPKERETYRNKPFLHPTEESIEFAASSDIQAYQHAINIIFEYSERLGI